MSRQKGNKNRLKVKRWFETQGYLVDTCEKTHRYAKHKDLYGAEFEEEDGGFDLIAIAPESVVFVQVKSNRPSRPNWFEKFGKKYCNNIVECLVATWYDYEGLRLQYYEPEGFVTDFKIDSKKINDKINK